MSSIPPPSSSNKREALGFEKQPTNKKKLKTEDSRVASAAFTALPSNGASSSGSHRPLRQDLVTKELREKRAASSSSGSTRKRSLPPLASSASSSSSEPIPLSKSHLGGSNTKKRNPSHPIGRVFSGSRRGNPGTIIMELVGDPSKTALVSKAFRRHTEGSYLGILKLYRNEPLLEKYVRRVDLTLSPKQQVQQIHQAVMTTATVTAIDIKPEVAKLEERAPLSLISVAGIIKKVEDRNLITFFSEVLEQIPQDIKPQINAKSSSAEQARIIRDWMGKNQLALSKITKLAPYELGLTTLPEEIGLFTALTVLDLQHNKLTHLPDSIGNLTALRLLGLQHNQLTHLPDSIGNLTALRSLQARNNQLTHLPNSFGNLIMLRNLRIGNNQLTHLPNSFGNLTALRVLDLENNQFTQLPESFVNLTALEYLNAKNNRLTHLPNSFGNLTALRDLRLENNRLTHLPNPS